MGCNNVKIISYLKNADLDCLSAKESIINHLNLKWLKHLRRFNVWECETDMVSQEKAYEDIQYILDHTFYFLNPNKESYYLSKIPLPKQEEPIVLIKVEQKFGKNNKKLLTKIENKTKNRLKNIKNYTLWEISINKKGGTEQDLQREMIDKVVVSKTINQGILVNLQLEDFECCEKKDYYK